MNPESRTQRLGAFWDALTIVVFLVLISLPTADYFFNLDQAEPPQENRLPARWPSFTGLKQSRDFVAGVEKYFDDHFGFRKRLLRLHHHWKDRIFHDRGSNQFVLAGRDGWFFYSGDRVIPQCARQDVWNEHDLDNWRRLLEMRRDWLRARGAKYLFVVVPDKHTVYPEYLPDWLKIGVGPSKVQQLMNYMKAHSTVEVLDLSQALMEAKQTHLTYFKTDTHWNNFGAFVGYRTLVQALARQFPDLTPLPLETLDWKSVECRKGGDLTRMMGTADVHWETALLEPVVRKPIAALENVYDAVRLPQRGTKQTWPFFTLNTNASGRAIIVRDSFACGWYPYLGQHFNETIYLWKYENDRPQYEWNRPLIEREKPDLVIDEMLERFFCIADPLNLMLKDQSSEAQSATPPPE